MKKVTMMLIITIMFTLSASFGAEAANIEFNNLGNKGKQVTLEGNKGIIVDVNERLILLNKSLYKSFDTKERNKYTGSPIESWLNNGDTGFKSSLVNKDWIINDSISLLTKDEYTIYKDYLNEFSIGWLKDAMIPADEPYSEGKFVDNTWNYVKAIMNGEIVGVGYGTNFYVSPVVLQLGGEGYKLKKVFGKPRVLVPNSAGIGVEWEEANLVNGDKVRFSNKWWTLVDDGNKRLLGEFNYLNYYLDGDEELDGTEKEINTYKFSDEITAYSDIDDNSIAKFLGTELKDSINLNGWVETVNIPTKEQYVGWHNEGISLGYDWMVFEQSGENVEAQLVIGNGETVKINPGETYTIRALVKLNGITELYIDSEGNITIDDGEDS